MYQGNWKCSTCGGAITQLPFQPRSESGLTCRTCYAKGKEASAPEQALSDMPAASEPAPYDDLPNYDELQVASEPAPLADNGPSGTIISTETSNPKPRIEGSWTCATCNGTISSLPFTPRDTSNLKCLDCFKRSKQ